MATAFLPSPADARESFRSEFARIELSLRARRERFGRRPLPDAIEHVWHELLSAETDDERLSLARRLSAAIERVCREEVLR